MSNKMILLVDDDREARLAKQSNLESNGYDTCFAPGSVAGIAEARKHQPNAIVIELGLPGDDGFVAIQQFKRHPSLSVIPIIAVSARDVPGNQQRALKAGAKVFLQKPVDAEELLAILRQVTGQPMQPGDVEITGRWKRTG